MRAPDLRIAADETRPTAVLRLGEAMGMAVDPGDPAQSRAVIDAALAAGRGWSNPGLRWRRGGDLGAAGASQRFAAAQQAYPGAIFLNGRPSCFPPMEADRPWRTQTPAATLLNAPFGYLAMVAGSPMVLGGDRAAVASYSSAYAGLAHVYDRDVEAAISRAPFIEGRALVLHDDASRANYCHWLIDWLPRLALMPSLGEDVSVLVSPVTTAWQAEMLRAAGFGERQIAPLGPWDVVQARNLLVPGHLSEMFHPAFKGSAWAVDFVRRLFLDEAAAGARPGRRLYVSRGDATRRRVVNEAELFARLERHGFELVTPGGLGVAEQARLFASAEVVAAPHGAALTNLVFCGGGARVLELFPRTYGTPSFWILAKSRGLDYATYVVDGVESGSRAQQDDLVVDVADFEARCLRYLVEPRAR